MEPQPSCEAGEHTAANKNGLSAVELEACERAAELFGALGDPSRLHLLVLLGQGERCVSEIASLMEDSLPTVSQRLRLLRNHRIVRGRRSGKHVYYSLEDEHIRQLVHNALDHAGEF